MSDGFGYETSTLQTIGGTSAGGNFGAGMYLLESPWDTGAEVFLIGFDSNGASTMWVATDDFILPTQLPITNPPAAPATSTATSGGTVANGTYTIGITAVGTSGETALSPTAAQITTGTNISTITVTLPSLPTNATGWNIYIGAVNITSPLWRQNATPQPAGSFVLTAPPVTNTNNPPAANQTSTGLLIGESGFRGTRFDSAVAGYVPISSDWVPIPEGRLYITVQASAVQTFAFLTVKWRRTIPRGDVVNSYGQSLAAFLELLQAGEAAGPTRRTYAGGSQGSQGLGTQWDAETAEKKVRLRIPTPWNPRTTSETERAVKLGSGRPDIPKTATQRKLRG